MPNEKKPVSSRRRESAKPAVPEKKSVNPTIPIVLMIATLGVTIYVLTRDKDTPPPPKKAEAPVVEEEKTNPFADLPKDKPAVEKTEPGITVNGKTYPPAPAHLAEDPSWKKAVALGNEADALMTESQKAASDGERADKEKAAAKKYEDAIEMSGDWEQSLIDKYSDHDLQVKAIVGIRSLWLQRSIALGASH